MRLFFTKKELKLRKKRVIMMIACMAVLLAGYLILTWPKKVQPEAPTVIVEPAEVGDVEIFGEYVGRIRAQQFVEVRARVDQEELLDYCKAMAKKIMSKASFGVTLAKQAINTGMDTDLESGLKLEANLFGLAFSTHDKAEGMQAFLEKRKAELTDF